MALKVKDDALYRSFINIISNAELKGTEKLTKVRELVATECDGNLYSFVFEKNSEGRPFLFSVVYSCESLLVKYFLDHSADAKVVYHYGKNQENRHGVLHELFAALRRMADPTPKQIKNVIDIAKMLIEGGADVNLRDDLGYTPLAEGLKIYGSTAIVRFKPESPEIFFKILNYKSLAEAVQESDIIVSDDDITVDEKSSAAHAVFNFFHSQVKEFDPQLTFENSTYARLSYEDLLQLTTNCQLRRHMVAPPHSDDKRNAGIREDFLRGFIPHVSLATREAIVRKHPQAKWILPKAMQKSLGRG